MVSNREAGAAKTRDIPRACAHHLERDIVDDVEPLRSFSGSAGR
jgi:hypothetical protein